MEVAILDLSLTVRDSATGRGTEKGYIAMKAEKQKSSVSATSTGSDELSKLLEQYGCGPVQFSGTDDALYERHLVFDNVIEATTIGARERFEAFARSVRDILSQRWVRTEETYERENPKRVYYLSMEFLIGRSLANNVTNLLLDPTRERSRQAKEPRLARAARTGTRRRTGQRRARTAGGLLPRFHGHDAAPGDGLRPALRIRHLQAVHPGRLAAGTAGQLAASPGSLGSRAPARDRGSQAELLLRDAWRQLARGRRPAVDV